MSTAQNFRERAAVREQSERIAQMLTAAGISGIRDDANALFTRWLHSGRTEALPSFRRITIIPEVCAAVRAPKIAALGFWLQRNPGARLLTLTTGHRYRLPELRPHLLEISDRIRQLNRTLRTRGAELVFRSTEIGPGNPGQTGPAFSPSFQCLAVPTSHALKLREWMELCGDANAAVHGIPGAAWQVQTKPPTVADFARYFAAPSDLVDLGQDGLAGLFRATHRVKLFHPLGSLAEEIRTRRLSGRKLVRVRKGNGFAWKEVTDHNAEGAR